MTPLEDEERVTLYEGQLSVVQHHRGYRHSFDALLLAHWCRKIRGQALDIGTGCGVIALSLALLGRIDRAIAVELQSSLADRAHRAAEHLHAQHPDSPRVSVICDRVQRVAQREEHRGRYDLVVSNPPYFQSKKGRTSPEGERKLARHDLTLSLEDLVHSARLLLKPGGAFAMIYPARRQATLFEVMRRHGIEPQAIRPVYPAADRPAKLILIRGERGASEGLTIEPPMILRAPAEVGETRGPYSKEAQIISRGAWR